jgi:hypothetical protein
MNANLPPSFDHFLLYADRNTSFVTHRVYQQINPLILELTSNAVKQGGSECGAEYEGHWSLFIYYIILKTNRTEKSGSYP